MFYDVIRACASRHQVPDTAVLWLVCLRVWVRSSQLRLSFAGGPTANTRPGPDQSVISRLVATSHDIVMLSHYSAN